MDCCGWYWIAMGYDDSGMPLLTQPALPRDSDDLERHMSKLAFPHRLAGLKTGLLRYLARFDMSRRFITTQDSLDDLELDLEPRDALQEAPLQETPFQETKVA